MTGSERSCRLASALTDDRYCACYTGRGRTSPWTGTRHLRKCDAGVVFPQLTAATRVTDTALLFSMVTQRQRLLRLLGAATPSLQRTARADPYPRRRWACDRLLRAGIGPRQRQVPPADARRARCCARCCCGVDQRRAGRDARRRHRAHRRRRR